MCTLEIGKPRGARRTTPGGGRVRLEVGGSQSPCMSALVSLFFGRRGRDAGRRLGTSGLEAVTCLMWD